MKRNQAFGLWRSAAQFVLGNIALALVTLLCFQLQLDLSTSAFMYLIVIVLLSLMGNFISSVILSIIAVGCLRYFFTPPIFNFRADNPLDAVAAVAFLVSSLIVTGLVRGARKKADAALRAQERIQEDERELRQLIDVVPQHIFVMTADGAPLSANEVWLEYAGLTQSEVRRKDYRTRLYHPHDLERVRIEREGAVSRGVEWRTEARFRRKDGQYRWFLIRANPLRNQDGSIIRWYGSATDIDDRKRAEDALREQAKLLDLTHDSVFVRDMNNLITYWNRGAEELYGWRREEAIGKVSHLLLNTSFPEPLEQITAELLRAGRWEGKLVHTKRDGTQVMVASRWSMQTNEQGRPVATLETNNDITVQKQAEAALQERERRYRTIFQTTGVSIWEEDFSRVKVAIDVLKKQGVRDFRQYFADHPAFIREAIAMVKIIDVNDATVALFGARSRDELLVSLHKIFVPVTLDVFTRELLAIAEGQTSFQSEAVLQTLKGDNLTVLFEIRFPPEPATFDSVLVSVMDVTERKRAEEELHQAQSDLAHVTRVTTLGGLTASIAHEVNQPLTGIVTNGAACLRWLDQEKPVLDEARRSVEDMVNDAQRASEVIQRIRALSRKSDLKRTPLDVNEVVDEVIRLVRREVLGHGATLRRELTPALPMVLADRVQLQQVIINLVMNGLQSMLSVTDRPRDLAIRSRRHQYGRVLVEVRDSGVGIDPKHADQLFNAFFTTKSSGMGMGLSICRSIIEAHGGRVWASNDAGPGAIFQFTLPKHEEAGS
jgi:PAS domain S-box-containing protein